MVGFIRIGLVTFTRRKSQRNDTSSSTPPDSRPSKSTPTFYRLPAEKVFKDWSQATPPGFIYAVKGSRAVTHMKRLKPGAKSFPALPERCQYLGPHLGPILWQLPPSFPKNTERLTHFLQRLPHRFSHAIEFRHPTWLDQGVGEILNRFKVAKVWVSSLACRWTLT